jgi:hypothetical protein
MLYQKLRVPDYITYLGTCIYIFGKTGGVIWPLSLCPLLVAQAINITFHLWFLLPYTCSTLYLILYGFFGFFKNSSSRLHNLPRYMYIYIWENRWSHMAPKPMSTVGIYDFYYRIHVVPCIWFCMDSLVFSEIHIVTTCNCLSTKF